MPAFKFNGKKILIISPEPWKYINVSKHHYARSLAALKNSVYFLDPPEDGVKSIECENIDENLSVIRYRNPYIGLRFFPGALRKYLNKRLFEKFQEVAQTKFDVVFLFENSRFYDLDFLPDDVLSIYFQVDEDQNFHPAEAARSGDLIIAINDIIQEILSKHRTPVFKIPHAFSGKFSENALRFWRGEQVYQKPSRRLRAYYVGNLDHNFSDTNLIASLVLQKQEIDFVFIGPYSTGGQLYNSIKSCTNVQLLGKVPADSIPELLDETDLLFFAYREDFLSSSHKIMEYLASGKAIVTTKVEGYPEDPDLFYCSGSSEAFFDMFDNVCNNIEEANKPERMKKRIQFAMDNTYDMRIKQIEELINSNRTQ